MANDSATAVSDPGRAAEATVVDGVVTDQKCYLMSNGEFWGISRWNGKSDWGDRYTMTLVADAPPAVSPPAVSPPDAPAWWYCEPCDVRVASSLTHVCKPHAPAKAPDRSGCAPWCGMDRVSSTAVGREPGEGFHVSLNGNDDLEYCSPACRDAKCPPAAPPRCEHGLSMTTDCLECATHATPASVVQQAKGLRSMKCTGCTAMTDVQPSCISWRCAKCCESTCQDCRTENVAKVRVFGKMARRYSLCDVCFLGREESASSYCVGDGILRDPSRPGLLPRARLAHSMGVEDPTLEDC